MFLYFDLGNVVVRFDYRQCYEQIAAVAGISPDQVVAAVFNGDVNRRFELGELSSREFYEEFCRATGKRPDFDALFRATSNIFTLNHSLLPVLAALEDGGYRLGLLSNTSVWHWQWLMNSQYGILPGAFSVLALSFEIGAMKPDPRIYLEAARLAGVPPKEIFFCDDILSHVMSARAVGFDAVQFTTTPALVAELRQRGLRFNY